jgi:xanthine dehydrogenase large subunit
MPPNDATTVDLTTAEPLSVVNKPSPHDSARLHVRGSAAYIDDIREPEGTLHVAPGLSTIARGKIMSIDLDAVRRADGVVAVLTGADVPGTNDTSGVFGDDPMFADKDIIFHGQVLFAVVAKTRDAARRATKLAKVEVAAERQLLTIEDAIAADAKVLPDYDFGQGDAAKAIAASRRSLDGKLNIGGQEHFYLEGQAAFAIPGESGEMHVHSSTQDPTECQHIVARVLAMPDAFVTVETRRMGGAFGGKESQAAQTAAIAALAARVTGHPCKMRLDRDDDFVMTGKRHDFRADWKVGFDDAGRVAGYDVMLNARCGCSVDLSPGVVDRAMFHAANAYLLPASAIKSRRLRTNTVSNTAFRGFGGPKGMLAIERVMDAIAHDLRLDPLDVRKANLYRGSDGSTPYGQKVEDADVLIDLVERLEISSDYRARRAAISAHNATNPLIRMGIALTPVQFGISFTLIHMNQAGALVHVYQDGSVHLNHGGTEMGQGLFTKVAQVVAEEFGIPLDWVRITATNTAKVPNASPTAASSGSDLNGMAARIAAGEIKQRMIAYASEAYDTPADRISFRDGVVVIGNKSVSFPDLAKQCRRARVQLSHAGFYKTPKIEWDREARKGRPFLYFAYGASCSEVAIDTLTGEMKVERVDILHDVGRSLNPALDIGQIEGGFVQGMGWLTTEELVFDDKGRLTTHAPSTYKIPVASDVPADFRCTLLQAPNREATIYRSKAVGEPPLMLAISVYSAVLDALQSIAPGKFVPLDAPATPERILMAAQALAAG